MSIQKNNNKIYTIVPNLVLFGGPGSGKGTQSAKIIDRYSLYHISTGELLRDHISRGTELGKRITGYMESGSLIPDDLMIDVLAHELDTNAKGGKGVVFDGFPRTVEQARALDALLEQRGMRLDGVIGLEVPDDELVNRLLSRAKIEGRSDDNPESIKNRLKVYHSQTEPLKGHYTSQGRYKAVQGLGDVDEIFSRIAGHIDSLTRDDAAKAAAEEMKPGKATE